MTNFIPIFPLSIIVYPGELCKLHIFEPRYKQLITECVEQKKSFGIPAVIKDTVNEFGTLVQVNEILKTYDDGKMDIVIKGQKIFRMLEQITTVPDKLYSGAIVSYPELSNDGDKKLMQKVITNIKQLHQMINVSKTFDKPDEHLTIYDIAHYAGLSLEEEYELLQLTRELHRQEYLKRNINNRIAAVKAAVSLSDSSSEMKEFMGFSLN